MRAPAPAQAAPAPMPARQAPDQCDCTVHCGDDPWLKDGRSTPCAAKVKRDRERAEAAECFALQRRIADEAARSEVACEGVEITTATGTWLDLSAAPEGTADSARYLVLRRLAERHPEHPLRLRLLTHPAAHAALT